MATWLLIQQIEIKNTVDFNHVFSTYVLGTDFVHVEYIGHLINISYISYNRIIVVFHSTK